MDKLDTLIMMQRAHTAAWHRLAAALRAAKRSPQSQGPVQVDVARAFHTCEAAIAAHARAIMREQDVVSINDLGLYYRSLRVYYRQQNARENSIWPHPATGKVCNAVD